VTGEYVESSDHGAAAAPLGRGLEVRDLTVRYPGPRAGRRHGARIAVHAANLHLGQGASMALVGPSGSGKSSLLMALAGVVESTGSIHFNGEDLTRVPTHRRGFGLVFQDGQLFNHLSVAQNIAFGLRVRGDSRAQQSRRVAELLNLVGLPDAADRPVTQLSGGERQRIALARTLAPRPRLVLLDEPLSSLDADLRTRLAADVRAALTASGASWIVVTHDLSEAESMADAVVTMRDGTLT